MIWRRPMSTLFPYTTLFRSADEVAAAFGDRQRDHALARGPERHFQAARGRGLCRWKPARIHAAAGRAALRKARSEEHTSELQSRRDLVCRLLLVKKNSYSFC